MMKGTRKTINKHNTAEAVVAYLNYLLMEMKFSVANCNYDKFRKLYIAFIATKNAEAQHEAIRTEEDIKGMFNVMTETFNSLPDCNAQAQWIEKKHDGFSIIPETVIF